MNRKALTYFEIDLDYCALSYGVSPCAAAIGVTGDGGYQAISASGAISPTAGRVNLSVDGTKAYTLADGVVGHEIDLFCVAGTNTPRGTVTIATVYGSQPTTHVFTNQGQRLKLRMTATGWAVVGKVRAGTFPVVVGTTVLTGVDLVAIYDLSVTGTVSSTTTKAIPDAQLDGEQIEVRCSTAASTPAGSIGFTGKSLAAAAHTSAGAIDATTDYFVGRWNGAAFLELFANGIMSTVRATRAATDSELLALTKARLRLLVSHGVTTVEIKSGYGLTVSIGR